MNNNVKLTASVVSLSAGAVGLGVAVASLLGIQSGAYAATPESYSSVNWTGLLSLLPTGAGIWGIVSSFLKSGSGQAVITTVVDSIKKTQFDGKLDSRSLVHIAEDMAKNLIDATGTDTDSIPETTSLTVLWSACSIRGNSEGVRLTSELAEQIRSFNKGGVKK